MDLGLRGKVAMLAGASQGIAKAAAYILAAEVGKHNVRVVGINPGPVNTARYGRLLSALAKRKGKTAAEVHEEYLRQTPLGRVCEPEDVGNLVAFLASDKAGFLNGTVITLDGGMSKAIL